jgi:16S rRNA (guanine1516-N2)-methyltransferase
MPPSWIGPEVTLAPSACGRDGANARRFGITLAPARDPSHWQLVRAQGRMQLCTPPQDGALAVELNLTSGPMARRLRSTRRDEPLPRACGLHRDPRPLRIVDATAGLCRDAMVLASLGCTVTAVEVVPALAFLAHDAVETSWLATTLQVHLDDAEQFLLHLGEGDRPEVVCIDPMFAAHGSASVKKDMQVCRLLVGPPRPADALLTIARRVARTRVVVKRDPAAPPLGDGVAFAVAGERVRFDVYLTGSTGPG